mmetsp:Transcript_6770/g.17438  ORF Transcript_6770/g.17438 Transcript_6770/m.17438 type:complete len:324 (-) Transcript_6770:141-1112(-)
MVPIARFCFRTAMMVRLSSRSVNSGVRCGRGIGPRNRSSSRMILRKSAFGRTRKTTQLTSSEWSSAGTKFFPDTARDLPDSSSTTCDPVLSLSSLTHRTAMPFRSGVPAIPVSVAGSPVKSGYFLLNVFLIISTTSACDASTTGVPFTVTMTSPMDRAPTLSAGEPSKILAIRIPRGSGFVHVGRGVYRRMPSEASPSSRSTRTRRGPACSHFSSRSSEVIGSNRPPYLTISAGVGVDGETGVAGAVLSGLPSPVGRAGDSESGAATVGSAATTTGGRAAARAATAPSYTVLVHTVRQNLPVMLPTSSATDSVVASTVDVVSM